MHVKSIVSAIAMTAALTLGGAAYAQTMYSGVEVSADDLPALQERCDQLMLAADKDGATEGSAMASDGTAGGSATTTDGAEEVNEMANALSTVDLDTVTLEGCNEAGLSTTAQ